MAQSFPTEARFTRQYSVGPYIADFACRRARLIVEVDGGQHEGSDRDLRRTADLTAYGWRVLRYWNHDVLADTDAVILDILTRGHERLPPGQGFEVIVSRPPRRRKEEEEPPPPPPRSRGGESAE